MDGQCLDIPTLEPSKVDIADYVRNVTIYKEY